MVQVKLILGDQLNAHHSWFREPDASVLYVMAELRQEADYACHHRQKLLAFLAAMRQFAAALAKAGHRVRYFSLDDSVHFEDLPALLRSVLKEEHASGFSYQQPDEYRLDEQLSRFCQSLQIETECVDSEHFLTPKDAWDRYPNHRMEFFYRALRREHGVLLTEDGKPEGGRWNFDGDNRDALPRDPSLPEPLLFAQDVSDIDAMLERHGVSSMGNADPKALLWPLSRSQSRQLLAHFLDHCLPHFGRYQDAMTPSGWSLYHSRLSFSLNTKMLHPMEVIRAVEAHWREDPERVSLAQAEGFIRQVLGWREYVRALYWRHMPGYRQRNYLRAQRSLPPYFWTGETRMACMAHAIGQSLDYAYAHHIQRLMITGNFALLAGVHPDEVDQWYLGIYIDAVEWVEMPNTRGMSQYADGGLMGSKPYAASGQYIHKMSHYCGNCAYNVKEKTGEGSCPFNSLYWHFLHRNRERLKDNVRLKLVYANWDRQSVERRQATLETAEQHLRHINTL